MPDAAQIEPMVDTIQDEPFPRRERPDYWQDDPDEEREPDSAWAWALLVVVGIGAAVVKAPVALVRWVIRK